MPFNYSKIHYFLKEQFGKMASNLCGTWCSEKLCFFKMHFNPSLAYITVRDLESSQRNSNVHCRSYWLVIFCTTNSSRVLARERWQTLKNSWKNTQYLMNTLYNPIVKEKNVITFIHSLNDS